MAAKITLIPTWLQTLMIDEKLLLHELKTEYRKTLALFYETRNELFAAELNALDAAIKIVKSQKKIRLDPDAPRDKNKFPEELLSEWEQVTKELRRCFK